jgi:hypothetical protein
LAWEAVGIKEIALNANAFPIMVRLDMVSSLSSRVDRMAMMWGTFLLVSKTKAPVGATANPAATQTGANGLMLEKSMIQSTLG